MSKRVCPVCGESVQRKGLHGPWPTYCSRKCQNSADYVRRRDAGKIPPTPSLRRERDCTVCGKPMGVVSKNRKVCSPRCQEIVTGKTCSIDGCDRPVKARGLCATDWSRWNRATNGLETYAYTPAQKDKYHRRRAAMYGAQKGDPVNHQAIYERDRWVCGVCRRPVDSKLSYPDPRSASLDHVVPLSRGGRHDPSNVQLAHLACNKTKGAR